MTKGLKEAKFELNCPVNIKNLKLYTCLYILMLGIVSLFLIVIRVSSKQYHNMKILSTFGFICVNHCQNDGNWV